jgi:hypothetical protein
MQQQTGKILIVIGSLLLLAGLFFYFSDRLPFFGKVPGDMVVKKKNFTFYFPLGTSILISLLLSLLFYLISRFR